MQFKQSVLIDRPVGDVWTLFEDVPRVARCMPGAELTEDRGEGRYAGKVSIKLGPFGATFEGEVEHRPDAAARTGVAEGRGIDRRGGSRSRLVMNYALQENGDRTELLVDADIQLSGPIAQFGRPAIVTETAKLLIGQFVSNVEAQLREGADGAAAAPAANNLNALKLGGKVVGASVKRWLGRDAD
jgi:carbon monoxide dehydrogenase subunit G